MKKSKIDGSYDPRYYTLDRLNEVSLSNISLNLKQFMKDYDITEYPIDCFRLVKKIQDAKLIHLEVLEEGRMSAAFNAVATYLPEVDSFQIVMKPVPKDWQKRSSWRRCNFSLAHELGHVFCGHLDVPKNMKSLEYGVFMLDSGKYVGNVGLINISIEHRHADISYYIDKDIRSQGIATEASAAMLKYGFCELGFEKISGLCMSCNSPSRRVMEKLGMKYEGTSRNELFKNGIFYDIDRLSILKSEYFALNTICNS